MAKIYCFKTKALLADLPRFDFTPVNDTILDSTDPLTKSEFDLIQSSIKESEQIMDQCLDSDEDVIDFHDNYLSRCEKRLQVSIKAKIKASV